MEEDIDYPGPDVETEIENPNSIWRPVDDDMTDAAGQITRTRRFWRIDPDIVDHLSHVPVFPIFFPFLDPFVPPRDNDPLMLLSESTWNALRSTVKDRKPTNWARMRRDKRNLAVVLGDGTDGAFVKFRNATPATSFKVAGGIDRSAFWVDTFDGQFKAGQDSIHDIANTIQYNTILLTPGG
jgi:hypothetical protein